MIFDRTQTDVNNAIKIRSEKVQKNLPLTDEDVSILEKGTLTINTLNRIESKQEELTNLFNEMGYWNIISQNRSWQYKDFFLQEDFDRILANLESMKLGFFAYRSTPEPTNRNYRHFQAINNAEKILNDLDVMISDVKSRYKRCGIYRCGGLV